MVITQHPAAPGQGVLVECAGLLISPSSRRSAASLLAEVRVSGWSSPSTRRRRVRVSFWSWRACWCSPSDRGGRGRGGWLSECVGVVLAQHPAEAGEGVVLELAGLLVLAQRSQGEAEEAGCAQCFWVVLALDSAAAGEGVVLKLAGLLMLAKRSQGEAEEAGSAQCE